MSDTPPINQQDGTLTLEPGERLAALQVQLLSANDVHDQATGSNVCEIRYLLTWPGFGCQAGIIVRIYARHGHRTEMGARMTELRNDTESILRMLYGDAAQFITTPPKP
jgi:hypothetical protein